MTYRLIDLAYDPHQPRDSHGRWTTNPATKIIHDEANVLEAWVKSDGGPIRTKMPQLSGVPLPGSKADREVKHAPGQEVDLSSQFEPWLRSQGYNVTDTKVRVSALKPTQDQLVKAKIEGIARYMETAPADSPVYEPLFVTNDYHVIDGHHRWAGNVIRDKINGTDSLIKVRVVDLPVKDALTKATEFMDYWGLPKAGMNDKTTISKFANLATVGGVYRLKGDIDLAITPGGRIGDASPLGKGPRRLSDYEREIAHALIRKGKKKRDAIKMARGLLKNAAATGRWAGRGRASAPVRAGAVASIAQRKTF